MAIDHYYNKNKKLELRTQNVQQLNADRRSPLSTPSPRSSVERDVDSDSDAGSFASTSESISKSKASIYKTMLEQWHVSAARQKTLKGSFTN